MSLRFVPWVQPPSLKFCYKKINNLPEKDKIQLLIYLDWWATIMMLLNITNTDTNRNISISIDSVKSSIEENPRYISRKVKKLKKNNVLKPTKYILEFYDELNDS